MNCDTCRRPKVEQACQCATASAGCFGMLFMYGVGFFVIVLMFSILNQLERRLDALEANAGLRRPEFVLCWPWTEHPACAAK
jgi:hypothetical protein